MLVNKLVLTESTSVDEIVRRLDMSGIGVLPIVDRSNKLIGLVTDGDLRRALLNKKFDLHDIINKAPKTVLKGTPKSEIVNSLKRLRFRHMPIVDDQHRLVDLVCLENLAADRKNQRVVIMAGGLGSRLGDITRVTPKPMLPINGRPILEHLIENLKYQGFFDFILCLNYKADIIKDYFGSGKKLGVEITYTLEQKRLGTAGALSLIDRSTITSPIIVTNADVIAHVDFEDLINFHIQSSASATMCVKRLPYEMPYARVEFDSEHNLQSLTEKPKIENYINAGIYVLGPEVLDLIPADTFFDMPSLFIQSQSVGLITKVYPFEDYWIDIGSPKDYSIASERTMKGF